MILSVVDSYPFGSVVIYDESFTYLVAGGPELLENGLDPKAMVDSTVYEVLPREVADLVVEDYRKAFQGEVTTAEVPFRGAMVLDLKRPDSRRTGAHHCRPQSFAEHHRTPTAR